MSAQADLVGKQLTDDQGRVLTVVGPVSWSPNYMELTDGEGFRTVRNTALLQRYFAATRA